MPLLLYMKHIDSINACVLFTDIKDFTLKSSLLTQKQIEILLNKQDEIVLPIIKKYFWKIIKTIWDSYMIVFERAENTIKASIAIQVALQKYNKTIRLNLYKLELRITADYGLLDHQQNIKWEDYFGETVNIAARLQNTTPENKIFISESLRSQLPDIIKDQTVSLGKTNFKWVLHDIPVYEVIYKLYDLKKLKNWSLVHKNISEIYLSEDSKKRTEEIDKSIFNFASVAAIMWVQPLPFIDTYSVLPLHMYLLKIIANKYWFTLNKEQTKEIVSTLASSIWSSYAVWQSIVGVSKIGTLGLWGYLLIPLNFWLTYAIGKIMSYYFYQKTQWVKASNSELKKLFQYSTEYGKNIVKKDKKSVVANGKKYKDQLTNSFLLWYSGWEELLKKIMKKNK